MADPQPKARGTTAKRPVYKSTSVQSDNSGGRSHSNGGFASGHKATVEKHSTGSANDPRVTGKPLGSKGTGAQGRRQK